MKYSLTIITFGIRKLNFFSSNKKNSHLTLQNLFSGYKNGRLFPYLKYSRYQVFGQNGLPYQHHNYQALKYFSIKENIIKIIIPKVLRAIKPSIEFVEYKVISLKNILLKYI